MTVLFLPLQFLYSLQRRESIHPIQAKTSCTIRNSSGNIGLPFLSDHSFNCLLFLCIMFCSSAHVMPHSKDSVGMLFCLDSFILNCIHLSWTSTDPKYRDSMMQYLTLSLSLGLVFRKTSISFSFI